MRMKTTTCFATRHLLRVSPEFLLKGLQFLIQTSIGPGQNPQTLQLSMRLSNKSWIAGDDDSDDEDPFADVGTCVFIVFSTR